MSDGPQDAYYDKCGYDGKKCDKDGNLLPKDQKIDPITGEILNSDNTCESCQS